METNTIFGNIDLSSAEFEESIDQMKLFFDREFQVTDKIIVKQPTIQDVIDYPEGEDGFMFLIRIFTGNTTYFKVSLWDQGVDWNDLTDWELFVSLVKSLPPNSTKVILEGVDFGKMITVPLDNIENDIKNTDSDTDSINNSEEKTDKENKFSSISEEKHQKFILYDPENDIEFNEITYLRVRNYLRHMFNIFPKVEVGIKSKRIKKEIVNYDKKVLEKQKKNSSGSFFMPLISTLLVYPGFKYKKEELRQVGIVEFLDAVQRISVIENSLSVMHGMYSGFVDGSKIKPESYNFMRDLNTKQITDAKEIAMNSITSKGET